MKIPRLSKSGADQGLASESNKSFREKARTVGYKAIDAVVDNPRDTAAYVVGDLVLPGILAKKAAEKWQGPKGKAVAAGLAAYAMSPVGLTGLGIMAKNKWKAKRAAKEKGEE